MIGFLRAVMIWSEERTAMQVLNAKSDRELRDLGIDRFNLARVVKHGRNAS